jgi:DNA-binding MarR family transcriptional regulator
MYAPGHRSVVDDLADAYVAASRALVGIAVHSLGAAPVEVTVAQYRVLVLVRAAGELTVGDVAVQLGVNQSNATRHCDRLQRLGLVARRRSTSDGRVVRVALTDAGRDLVDTVLRQRRADVRRVLDRLDDASADAALAALGAFNEAAQELERERSVSGLW